MVLLRGFAQRWLRGLVALLVLGGVLLGGQSRPAAAAVARRSRGALLLSSCPRLASPAAPSPIPPCGRPRRELNRRHAF